ncbi:MAG: ABC transporter ATP-binding protein/permease [Methanomassiliicoccaceae archaeon]|nr:ABC transporter ATP-binding protein/permease [Methanomassiliicoccaceae archaeon]
MSEESDVPQVQKRQRGPGGGGGRRGGMGAPTEKPKEFKKTWARTIRYGKSHMPTVIIAMIATIIGAACSVYAPNKIADITTPITNFVFGGVPMDMHAITMICLLMIGLYISSSIFTFIQQWIMATVSQDISKRMRTDITKKINRLPFKYFGKASYGDVLSRMTNDADTIGTTLNQSLTTLMTAVAMLVGAVIMMFYTNWIMAIAAIAATAVGFGLMFVIIHISQKYFAAQQFDLGNCNGLVEEAYSGHTVIKAYNSGKEFKKKFEEINDRLYFSAWKSQFFSGLMYPIMSFVGNFGYVVVCIVGAILTINGNIEAGVVFSFMVYVRLFTQPLSQLAQAASSLQRTAAASEHIFEFLDEKEMEDESQKLRRINDVKGDVEFRHVKFGYTPERTIIHDFSADVKAGQKIAIVGPTGAGKTTLVNLLMRFYELDGGNILLDGVPTTEIAREDVHNQFCMVLQDTWLFEGTIKENIIYSKENVTDEDVINACKTVGLHHYIQTLPDGYDTMLNDTANLSEGQKQLLTIARAIIKDSPLLILDEATSSVDTRTERIVQEAMDSLTQERTSFIIAHRLSTIKNANKILVLRDGDIVESGTHAELLSKGGFYAELYNSQFELAT